MWSALHIWLAVIGVAAFYLLFLRPRASQREELKEFYEYCDSFWQRLWLRVKHWWLIAIGAFALILPELPDLLTQIGMFDLSFFLPEEKAKWWSRVIGIAAFVLRMVIGNPMPKYDGEQKP